MTYQLIPPQICFNHRPNWGQGIKFSRTWRTNVKASITGKEQRSKLFTKIRRGIDFQVQTTSAPQTVDLLNKLRAYKHSVWGIPVWQHEMKLTQQLTPGDTVLYVDVTNNRNLDDYNRVIISANYATGFQSGEVSALADKQITISNLVVGTWAVNTRIYPLLPAKLAGDPGISPVGPNVIEVNLSFVESFDAEEV